MLTPFLLSRTIQESTSATTKAEVIRRTLGVFTYIVEEKTSGGQVFVVNEEENLKKEFVTALVEGQGRNVPINSAALLRFHITSSKSLVPSSKNGPQSIHLICPHPTYEAGGQGCRA